jgi:integrase
VGVKVREKVKGSGEWWLFIDYRGRRKAKRVGAGKLGKKAAELAALKISARLAEGDTGPLDPAPVAAPLTLAAFASTWLAQHAEQACKASTAKIYGVNLRRHILPELGGRPVAALTRADCRQLILRCREKGLSVKSIENICRTLSSLLSQAVEDGVLSANPALRLGRHYRRADEPRHEIRPLSRDEVGVFLTAARKHAPREHPLFLCALRTGMRLGELLGLQWGDVDFLGRFIEVRRNLVGGRVTTPKNGKTRKLDMSTQLTDGLRTLMTERKAETLRRGWGQVPEWVFCNESGGPLDGDNLRHRVFYRLLEKAELRRIRFHDLRHTYASLLIQNGESLAYVRDQLGHASIQLTVDTYGHLVPGANRQAVDRLDDAPEATARNPAATENTKGATA